MSHFGVFIAPLQSEVTVIYIFMVLTIVTWVNTLVVVNVVCREKKGRVSYYFCCYCTVGKHVEFIWRDLIWLECRAWFYVQWFNCPIVGRPQPTTANIEWVVVVWLLNSQTKANQSFTDVTLSKGTKSNCLFRQCI